MARIRLDRPKLANKINKINGKNNWEEILFTEYTPEYQARDYKQDSKFILIVRGKVDTVKCIE